MAAEINFLNGSGDLANCRLHLLREYLPLAAILLRRQNFHPAIQRHHVNY